MVPVVRSILRQALRDELRLGGYVSRHPLYHYDLAFADVVFFYCSYSWVESQRWSHDGLFVPFELLTQTTKGNVIVFYLFADGTLCELILPCLQPTTYTDGELYALLKIASPRLTLVGPQTMYGCPGVYISFGDWQQLPNQDKLMSRYVES